MEYGEDDYLMISGIQHFKFCRRQWALIHIEQQWEENVHTTVGELMHKRAHDPELKEKRKGLIVARALPVSSRKLGISGTCDVVEFRQCEDGIKLHGHRGQYSVYPIEYKKGRPKLTEEDCLQLAAQAMCLEEMFSTEIPCGALFFISAHRRMEVEFTDQLRSDVSARASALRKLWETHSIPPAEYGAKCNHCSIQEYCMPKVRPSAREYCRQLAKEAMEVDAQ